MAKITALFLLVAVMVSFATPVVIQPGPEGEDTYIKVNETTPQGDNVILDVRRGIGSGGYLTSRTFIRFNLSEYEGLTVDEAELRLWSVYRDELLSPIVVCRVSNAWDEADLIWDNKPPIGGAEDYLSQEGDYYYFDVKSMVYDWVTLGVPNYGMCINFENESGPNDGISFHSSDNTTYPTKRPALYLWMRGTGVEPASYGVVKAAFR